MVPNHAFREKLVQVPCCLRSYRWWRKLNAQSPNATYWLIRLLQVGSVMAVVAIALLTFFGWGLFGRKESSWVYAFNQCCGSSCLSLCTRLGNSNVYPWLQRVKVLLMVCCSVMQQPLRIYKPGDTLIIDKTGTLTGRPVFDRVVCPHRVSMNLKYYV